MTDERTDDLRDDVPPELARLLDRWDPGMADPEFRAVLLGRFLAGAEVEALERELTAQTVEPARAAFKSHLADCFVRGEFEPFEDPGDVEQEFDELEPLPSRPVARRSTRRPGPKRAPQRRLQLVVAAGVLAAAAILLVFLNRSTALPSPEWWPSVDRGVVRVDGQPLEGLTENEIIERLAAARTIQAGGDDTRLRFGDYFVVELGEGAEVDLESLGPDPVANGFVFEGEVGSYRFSTGPAFKTSATRLTFRSPDLEIAVVGTVFAVDIYEGVGTCICCCTGEVEVRCRKEGELSQVPHGQMRFVFDSDECAKQGPIVPHHLAPLEDLAKYWQ